MSQDKAVRNRYERFASTYNEIFGERQALKISSLAHMMPSPLPRPILDLGAGTGVLAQTLDTTVVALDFSPAMLAYASGDRVLADICALPFGDSVFGTVFSISSLIQMDQLAVPIQEMIRVAVPGGWIALSVLKTEDLEGIHRVLTHELGLLYTRADLGEDMGFVFRKPENL